MPPQPSHSPVLTEQAFAAFLERNAQFHQRVAAQLGCLVPYPDRRFDLVLRSAMLSAEHGAGALVLIAEGLHGPGYTLLRPQFETLVRSGWLMYAASDEWVERLARPLSVETADAAKDALMVAEMLKALGSSSIAPPGLVAQLEACRNVMWKALNSFAHGGLHPLARFRSGYPRQLSYDVLRNSNALLAMALQLAVIATDAPQGMGEVRAPHADFGDCLPITGTPPD